MNDNESKKTLHVTPLQRLGATYQRHPQPRLVVGHERRPTS